MFADLKHHARAVDVRYGRPLNREALGPLAVQRWGAGHGRAAQRSSHLGAVTRLADFGGSCAAVVGGVHVNAQLGEEAAHGNVAVENAAR